MKFKDIVSGYIGLWLLSLINFIIIVTLIIVALPMKTFSDIWISVSCYLLMYLGMLIWEYWPTPIRDPKQIPIRIGIWIAFLFPAALDISFIAFLPANIKQLIDSPSPKLKNFNDC